MRGLLWIVINFLNSFGGAIGYVALSFLIWDQLQGYRAIIDFNIHTLLGMLIPSVFVTFIAYLVNVKFIYALGLVVQAIAYIYVADGGLDLITIGLIYGAGYSMQLDTSSVVSIMVNKGQEMSTANAITRVLGSIVSIISPIVVGIIANDIGYAESLRYFAYLLFAVAALTAILPAEGRKVRTNILEVAVNTFRIPSIKAAATTAFGAGTIIIFAWGLTNVLMLEKLGSVDSWSYVSLGLAVMSIVLSIFLSKINYQKEPGKAKTIMFLPIIVIAVIIMQFLNDFTTTSFIVFIIFHRIYSVITGVTTSSYLVHLIQSSIFYVEKGELALNVYFHFFRTLGMLAVVVALSFIPDQLLNADGIIIGLVATTMVPLLLMRKI